ASPCSEVRDLRAECEDRSELHSGIRLRGASHFDARVKASPIHVGDFVYCRSRYYRDQLQLPEELGLVIEIKRSNFKILYPNDKRCWLPRDAVVRVRPEHLEYSTFLERIHYVIKRVHAQECELVAEDDAYRLALRIDLINHETVDDLRTFLAGNFLSLTVVPE